MESNLMAINTYHMTLNTSNVKTPDSWIECNRIGNLVMINGCAKITKAVNTYSVLNIASGAPVPCCNKQLYTVAIAQDNTYSNCFLEVSKSGAVNLLVRWQKASSGDIFYYEFCYICKQSLFYPDCPEFNTIYISRLTAPKSNTVCASRNFFDTGTG